LTLCFHKAARLAEDLHPITTEDANMKFALMLGLAGGLAVLPSFAAPQQERAEPGVAEAIRFEKAKQAAADRQARIEAARTEGQSADRSMTETQQRTRSSKARSAHKSKQPQQDQQQ
jgi:hypothetical protein